MPWNNAHNCHLFNKYLLGRYYRPSGSVIGSPFSGVRDISQVTTHRTLHVVRAEKRKHTVLGEHLGGRPGPGQHRGLL